MQGRLIIAITLTAFGADAALCGETARRMLPCKKTEQVQQRQPQSGQQPAQPQRKQPQACPIVRALLTVEYLPSVWST